jgi:hypothetical protein
LVHAVRRLADVLAKHSQINELRELADTGEQRGITWLADVLAAQGKREAAIATL